MITRRRKTKRYIAEKRKICTIANRGNEGNFFITTNINFAGKRGALENQKLATGAN